MRVRFYCEGRTERGIRDLFTPKLRERGLGLDVRSFNGNGELLRKIGTVTRNALEQGVRAVFCLIDLYKVPAPIPSGLRTVSERTEWLRAYIKQKVDRSYHDRFFAHIAVHEVEAWMLADEEPLVRRLGCPTLGPWPHPEEVNDQCPPSSVINDLFRRHHPRKVGYHKVKDGIPLLRELDCEKISQKCRFFRNLMEDLMSLSGSK